MPSTRRVKVLTLAVALTVLLILYYSGDARRHRDAEFYQRTVSAMEAAKAQDLKDSSAQAAFQDSENTGPNSTPEIATNDGVASSGNVPLEVETAGKQPVEVGKERKYIYAEEGEEEKSVAGRRKMRIENGVAGSEKILNADEKTDAAMDESPGKTRDVEAEAELNAILKRSPIILFSKSYCPYSRRAKALLLDTYNISPTPYVVELDQLTDETKESDTGSKKFSHPDDEALPLGKRLQNLLAENTGRGTVPNILVNGKSIGGSDDIAELDRNGVLAETIKSMGGKRIVKIEKLK
ncbi:putative glutaredoxin domain protein [Phaeomoniella chlamydospora]|uniref:Putative glutaredoxin domain protein n=1 Tax=Phaeomoniella chlamydospora TaxID=158046 RepID=A0A0G2HEW9_PHACM|nr:putative glutaredoxin domain protein [Phaeomoniella chlamydospora]